MTLDDIKKLLSSGTLFSLDRILAPKLAKLCYFLGLAAIFLWAFDHFYITFSYSFGAGLWGLLEIVVFGLLALVALRIFCEGVIVFFKAHSHEAAEASHTRTEPVDLVDELRDAFEDLAADEDEDEQSAEPPASAKPAAKATSAPTRSKPAAAKASTTKSAAAKSSAAASTRAGKAKSSTSATSKRRTVTRRTAKRSPKPSKPATPPDETS